jgi:hypothetical protein
MQTDLEPDAAVQAAAEWIANQRDHGRRPRGFGAGSG